MALKFLNKKGWHTGSLRNIENVWKAEQKHEAEQKKLEELKKQIHEERERAEFRLLQEQAGLVPKQERLEFLYDSGLAVGKGSSSGGFKELESYPKPPDSQTAAASSSSSAKQQSSVPGALFEDKPQSANDAWRKLHSDPLLLIRKREQEAFARVKNNPVQMAMIRQSVEAVKDKKDTQHGKEGKTKHHQKKSKHRKHSSSKYHSDSDNATSDEDEREPKGRKGLKYEEPSYRRPWIPDELSNEEELHRKRTRYKDLKLKERHTNALYDAKTNKKEDSHKNKRDHENLHRGEYYSKGQTESDYVKKDRGDKSFAHQNHLDSSDRASRRESNNRHRNPVKLSEEERAARLREMQMDAELHEEQRWKRLKKAEEKDAQEAIQSCTSGGRNFLDAAHEKGGSSTIEESVRRRKYYSQNRSEATERNAFRR